MIILIALTTENIQHDSFFYSNILGYCYGVIAIPIQIVVNLLNQILPQLDIYLGKEKRIAIGEGALNFVVCLA